MHRNAPGPVAYPNDIMYGYLSGRVNVGSYFTYITTTLIRYRE